MTQSKKVLRGHLQMLKCFADAYNRMQLVGAHSLFEFHILIRNEHGNLQKVFRYEIGTAFLPDHANEAYEDLYITLMKDKDISNYRLDCINHGIYIE